MADLNRQMRSYLSAVILSAAMQADGFLCLTGPMVRDGGSSGAAVVPMSSSRQVSSSSPSMRHSHRTSARASPTSFSRRSGDMFQLNASAYEEYMATRNKETRGEAVAPEQKQEASLFDSYMASREKQAALPPAEKEKSLFEEYMASRGMAVSPPGGAVAAPAAPSAAPTELSPYEEYMASRDKVKAVEAATTPEEKEKASLASSFLESSDSTGADAAGAPKEERAAKFVEYVGSRIKARLAPILQRLPGKHKPGKKKASPEADHEADHEAVSDAAGKEGSQDEATPINGAKISSACRSNWSVDIEYTVEEKVAMFDDYMASREKVTAASAHVTPEEVETVTGYDDYLASRAQKEVALKQMAPEEKTKSYFDDYISSRSGGGTSASSATGEKHVGSGGMADTRDPTPVNHADPRKSISAAPSFEEYLKSRG